MDFLTELIVKISNELCFNMPIDKTEWPEMRRKLEDIRDLIGKMPGLTFDEKAKVEKYLIGKPKKGRPKGSVNKPKKAHTKKNGNKQRKSLLECALNKQGISLKDIDENFNTAVKSQESQEV